VGLASLSSIQDEDSLGVQFGEPARSAAASATDQARYAPGRRSGFALLALTLVLTGALAACRSAAPNTATAPASSPAPSPGPTDTIAFATLTPRLTASATSVATASAVEPAQQASINLVIIYTCGAQGAEGSVYVDT